MRYCKDIAAGTVTLCFCTALTLGLGLVGRGVAAEATIAVEGEFVAFDPATHCEVVPDHPDCAVFKALVQDITEEMRKSGSAAVSPESEADLTAMSEDPLYRYEVHPDGSLTLVY